MKHALAGLLLLAGAGSLAGAPARIERVNVDLILVDIDARDAEGRPMHGLRPEDFVVRVDGIQRTLYSLDDSCGCGGGVAQSAMAAGGSANPDPIEGISPSSRPTASEPAQFIFYFDFALLDLDGRVSSFKEARRWIRETMRPEDRVMIVGHSHSKGAVPVLDFTSDRTRLLGALDEMEKDREFVDPHPAFLDARRHECESFPSTCGPSAIAEYNHGRRALRTMARFMETLDAVPGRKHLVLLHQIALFHPGAPYHQPESKVGNQEAAVVELSAAAVAARVAIHAASADDATMVGKLAAELTGGTYNRSRATLSRALDEARNRCECLYRLGFEPLDQERGRIATVTVSIRERAVANLRVKIRSAAERWLAQARHILGNPGGARDLPVNAALIPVTASRDRWTVNVRVALHSSALTRIPGGRSSHAEWEAGALLTHEGTKRTWEMLAASSMSAPSGATAPEWFVHEQTLRDLRPGIYRLSAFVRDRSADLFGGASAELELPDPSEPGTVGPIVLLDRRRLLSTDLPLMPRAAAADTRGRIVPAGEVPSGEAGRNHGGGPPYQILTWLCGLPAAGQPGPALERYLTSGDSVVMTFEEEGEGTQAGRCRRLADRLEAGLPDDSSRRYHLRWKDPAGGEPIAVEAALP